MEIKKKRLDKKPRVFKVALPPFFIRRPVFQFVAFGSEILIRFAKVRRCSAVSVNSAVPIFIVTFEALAILARFSRETAKLRNSLPWFIFRT